MPTILIVEDDESARKLTEARLKPYYDVRTARDGQEALHVLERHHVDLAIVDVMMPRMSGYDLVLALRRSSMNLPVLMLTALDSFSAMRDGFASGIDDYLTKPVNHEELRWRVKALLRRAEVADGNRVRAGSVTLDKKSYTYTWGDRQDDLPKKEFDLLFLLLSYPGTIFTKDQLLERVWGFHSDADEATLKTHVSRLRARFNGCGAFEIVNIRGLGYKAEVAEAADERP
ncbi:MAG: response regulator transcription factor [Eggerthellaceae bacterium]